MANRTTTGTQRRSGGAVRKGRTAAGKKGGTLRRSVGKMTASYRRALKKRTDPKVMGAIDERVRAADQLRHQIEARIEAGVEPKGRTRKRSRTGTRRRARSS